MHSKTSSMETTNFYLTKELVFKILLLLPVASLLRLRFVCRLWCSIISSREFVENHLNNSKKKQLPSVLKVFTYEDEKHAYLGMEDIFYMSTCYDVYVDCRDDDSLRIELPRRFGGTIRFFGSCNGLVCLVSSDAIFNTLYLWNPFTKLFKCLATPPSKLTSGGPRDYLGFGFDSVSNDYKILGFVSEDSFDDDNSSGLVAQLYSANDDSWKEIEVPETMKPCSISTTLDCVYAQPGALYFEGLDRMISFSLHDEVFEVYPYPNSEQHNRKSNVLEYKGSAAMIFESYRDGSVLSLWTLDDVSGNVSWTKKINLEFDFKMNRAVLYLGAGQFVVAVDDDKVSKPCGNSGYVLYDHKTRETKKVPLRVPGSKLTSVIKYTESLVSLKGFEQDTESSGFSY